MLVSCKAKVSLSPTEQADKCWRTIHNKGYKKSKGLLDSCSGFGSSCWIGVSHEELARSAGSTIYLVIRITVFYRWIKGHYNWMVA